VGEYRHCKECGRRFFAPDTSEFCSQSCFSQSTTEKERRPTKVYRYVAVACFILLGILAVDLPGLNYFMLLSLPPLRGHAISTFDARGPSGIRYLHEAVLEADFSDLPILFRALAECSSLDEYTSKKALLDDVSELYVREHPEMQKAAMVLYSRLGMVPAEYDFLEELRERELQRETLAMMKAVADPRFILPLALIAHEPMTTASFFFDTIEVLEAMACPNLHNAELLGWIAENTRDPQVQLAALKALSVVLWDFRDIRYVREARGRFAAGIRSLRHVASGGLSQTLREVAKQILDTGSRRERVFIKFGAVDEFERLFGKKIPE